MNFWKYILRRILLMLPTLLGITVLTFLALNIAPGGPVEQKLQAIRFAKGGKVMGHATSGQANVSPEVVEALKKQYGFDKPLLERYALWVKKLVRLDFGNSFVYGRPAIDVIRERAPVSLQFGLVSFVLTYLFAVLMSLYMASHVNQAPDILANFVLVALAALPAFMLGVILLVLFAGETFLDIFPIGYLTSDNYDSFTPWHKVWDRVHHFILPLICYLVGSFTTLALLGRNSLLQELQKDYVRTARAKGLEERTIFRKHALRNALIPLVTGIGGALAMFLSGSVLVESVFQLQGVGSLAMQAVMARDFNVVMAILVLSSLLMLVGNLVGDLIYVMIDPRVDFQ